MAQASYHSTFPGGGNRGVQIGQNLGSLESHHHYYPQRPETPPHPSLLIPFERDGDFVDRGTVLAQLHQQCSVAGSRTALVGLGGVGKSQLAIEYAYQVRERSPDTWVLWVHASNAARFEQSYRDIADKAKITGRQDPDVNVFKLVRDWLHDEKRKWVLVLDNVDDASFFQDPVRDKASKDTATAARPLLDYLPQCQNGSILVTSRSEEAALELVEPKRVIKIGPMSQAEAIALLVKKLGQLSEGEDTTALAEALEYMPLAIVQAAAYIFQRAPRSSVKIYTEEFQRSDRKKSTLLDYERGKLRRDRDACNSIILTWHISYDHIKQTMPSAADLLSLMSFFDRQGIPEFLLRDATGLVYSKQKERAQRDDENSDNDDSSTVESENDEGFDEAIEILRNYSFISVGIDKSSFEMHRLVQLSTQKWLKANGQFETWQHRYIKYLDVSFPEVTFENRARCQTLFPHAKSVTIERLETRGPLAEWASVLYKVAGYMFTEFKPAEAAQIAVKSMKARKTLFGVEDSKTLYSTLLVASIYRDQGRWQVAEELEVQVVETSKKILGHDHPDTLTSILNLSSTYSMQGRWQEAEELQMQVMETQKKILGYDHPDTLMSMSNLAFTYSDQGRWQEAEELNVQVMEARKKILGHDHPNTLTSISNLAMTYSQQGRWQLAEELEVQVVETSKKILGHDHPDTLLNIANLASTYYDQGRWQEAEELQMQVIEFRKKTLGYNHPDTLMSMSNLASTYSDQGRWQEAEELEVQVIETRKKILGHDHPNTLTSISNLAVTYSQQGRWQEAEELRVQVIETSKKILGHDHPGTLRSIGNLAATYSKQGRWQEAEELEVQVVETRKKILGHDHPDTLLSIGNLAATYSRQGRWQEAEELEAHVMENSKKILGHDHPSTLLSMNNLASMYYNQGRWQEAEELEVQVMETRKKILGHKHPSTLLSMNNLAFTWRRLRQNAKALQLMEDCVQLRVQILGAIHPDTISSSKVLSDWKSHGLDGEKAESS